MSGTPLGIGAGGGDGEPRPCGEGGSSDDQRKPSDVPEPNAITGTLTMAEGMGSKATAPIEDACWLRHSSSRPC